MITVITCAFFAVALAILVRPITSMYKVLIGTETAPTASGSIVTAITTLAVTAALHNGKTVLLSLLAGFTSTLPLATGSGMVVLFKVGIVTTSNSYIIATTGTDVFVGGIEIGVTTAATGKWFNPGATDNTITLDAAHLGGSQLGDWVEVQDISSGVWAVRGLVTGTATVTTPFSHN